MLLIPKNEQELRFLKEVFLNKQYIENLFRNIDYKLIKLWVTLKIMIFFKNNLEVRHPYKIKRNTTEKLRFTTEIKGFQSEDTDFKPPFTGVLIDNTYNIFVAMEDKKTKKIKNTPKRKERKPDLTGISEVSIAELSPSNNKEQNIVYIEKKLKNKVIIQKEKSDKKTRLKNKFLAAIHIISEMTEQRVPISVINSIKTAKLELIDLDRN